MPSEGARYGSTDRASAAVDDRVFTLKQHDSVLLSAPVRAAVVQQQINSLQLNCRNRWPKGYGRRAYPFARPFRQWIRRHRWQSWPARKQWWSVGAEDLV